MFTIKFYGDGGFRQRILEAESFTILRHGADGGAEITMHQKNGEGLRFDIRPKDTPVTGSHPPFYQKAIIENAAGRTTEIVTLQSMPRYPGADPADTQAAQGFPAKD